MSSDFSRLRLLVLLLVSTAVLAAFGCSDDDVVAPKPTPLPFSGDYAMENWTDSGITGGTTSIDPDSGSTSTAVFSYDVQLGNPGNGVSPRAATFEVPVPKSGIVTFDWVYTGFHAYYEASAYFAVYAASTYYTAIDQSTSGSFTFSGTAAINVSDTGTLIFGIGGSNNDSNSTLQGTLTITNFRTP